MAFPFFVFLLFFWAIQLAKSCTNFFWVYKNINRFHWNMKVEICFIIHCLVPLPVFSIWHATILQIFHCTTQQLVVRMDYVIIFLDVGKVWRERGREKALWTPAIIICNLYTLLTLEVSINWMSIMFFNDNFILNNKLLAIAIRHKFLINICHSLTLQCKGFRFLDDWVNGNCNYLSNIKQYFPTYYTIYANKNLEMF